MEEDPLLGSIREADGEGKTLDYIAVCVFVYFALDSNLGTNQLSTALSGKDTAGDGGKVFVTDRTKVELAKSLVDKFLCRHNDEDG